MPTCRTVTELHVGDRIILADRPCVVTAAPAPAPNGRVRYTVALPGGAPQHLVETPDRPVYVL